MEYIAIAAGMSALSACISEGVNWYWIYRHEEYKKLIKDIAENQIKFDAMKEKQLFNAGTQGLSQQKVQERKIKAFEDGLKAQQSKLMQMKSRVCYSLVLSPSCSSELCTLSLRVSRSQGFPSSLPSGSAASRTTGSARTRALAPAL